MNFQKITLGKNTKYDTMYMIKGDWFILYLLIIRRLKKDEIKS